MAVDTRVNEMIYNQLTREEYDSLWSDGKIDDNQLYLITDPISGFSVAYDNVYSQLKATNIQAAIDELNSKFRDYLPKDEVPTKLPNPNSITFVGGATGSYDGSQELTIDIPNAEDLGKKWVLKRTLNATKPDVRLISEDISDLNLKDFKIVFKVKGNADGTFRSYLKVGASIEWFLYDVPLRRDTETVAVLEVKDSGIQGLKEVKISQNINRKKAEYGSGGQTGSINTTNLANYMNSAVENLYLDSLLDISGSSVYIFSWEK